MDNNVFFKNDKLKNETFNQIWELVYKKYVLFDEKDINWELIKHEFENKLKNTNSLNTYKLIDSMLAKLGDPHTKISYNKLSNTFFSTIFIYNYGNDFYITQVMNLESNLKPGMKIMSVNGLPMELYIKGIHDKYLYKSTSMVRAAALNDLSFSDFKQSINIVASDGKNEFKEDIEMISYKKLYKQTMLDNTPINIKYCISKKFGDIGYIKILSFMNKTIVEEFHQAVGTLKHCNNVIIDLRGNVGGLIKETMDITSLFTLEKIELGYSVKRNESSKLYQFENPKKLEIKPSKESIIDRFQQIIILCDNYTSSSAEFIFIKALKGSNSKIKIIGNTTAGLVHSATVYKLFDESKLQITTIKYLDENGYTLKEIGIDPDIEVNNSIKQIITGEDYQLNYAIELCN